LTLKYNIHIIDLCKHSINSIPERTGVYVITHTFDNIPVEKYVGSSINLYKRIHKHYDKNIIYIDLYVTNDICLAQSLERILIELLNPATNMILPRLSEIDKELLYELDKDDEIRKHILQNVVKIGYRNLRCINGDEKEYTLKNFEVRKVQLIAGITPTISIPIEYGFKKGDSVKVEQIDENNVKLTKVK